MWIAKAAWAKFRDELTQARTSEALAKASHREAEVLLAEKTSTLDWMRHRVNALEKERAVLMAKLVGVALPTPELEPAGVVNSTNLSQPYMGGVGFEDVGDAEARQLGIFHDADGHITYDRSQVVSQEQ